MQKTYTLPNNRSLVLTDDPPSLNGNFDVLQYKGNECVDARSFPTLLAATKHVKELVAIWG